MEGVTLAAMPQLSHLGGVTFLQFREDGKKGPGVTPFNSPFFPQSQPLLTPPSLPPSAASCLPANLPQRQRSGQQKR